MSFIKAMGGLAAGATVIASALAVSVVLATEGYDLREFQDLSFAPLEAASAPAETGTALTRSGGAASWSEEWRDVQKAIPSSSFDARPAETF
jgi:hypothetical protein